VKLTRAVIGGERRGKSLLERNVFLNLRAESYALKENEEVDIEEKRREGTFSKGPLLNLITGLGLTQGGRKGSTMLPYEKGEKTRHFCLSKESTTPPLRWKKEKKRGEAYY